MPGTGDSRPSMALRSRDIEAPAGDWVLPGGYPESDESLASCAKRELAEETGLQRTESRCVLLHEAKVHGVDYRVIDVVFAADSSDEEEVQVPGGQDPSLHAELVPVADLPGLLLRPSMARFIQEVHRNPEAVAPVVVWKVGEMARDLGETQDPRHR